MTMTKKASASACYNWNSIPICLCSLPKSKFKRLLHGQLLNILMGEDTYVDVHTLIDKFRKLLSF